VFLDKRGGKETKTLASTTLAPARSLKLRISGAGRDHSFYYDADGRGWKPLRENDDGSILSTAVAGGFVGTVIGPYARSE
jgi:xylan 1,4-beta-xylosidase